MKIMISYQVDTPEEAKKILDSVNAEFNLLRIQTDQEAVERETKTTLDEASVINSNVVPLNRPNVNPGTSAITKIGVKTKEEIFYAIKHDHTPLARFEEHYKLLWARGEIKYDGQKYYL
ncbi:MAG: LLM class flavin-dependent oxidoreductase [Bacteroidia bacterium]|nr:LLM class flavin-dependent oxidoreductase [Bacteroidia bacterium]